MHDFGYRAGNGKRSLASNDGPSAGGRFRVNEFVTCESKARLRFVVNDKLTLPVHNRVNIYPRQ